MAAKLLGTWTEFTDFNLKTASHSRCVFYEWRKEANGPAIGKLLASVTLCFLFDLFAL